MELSRARASELLDRYSDGAPWARHCRVVAWAAASVAKALSRHRTIHLEHLMSMALLHDVGRSVTHDPALHGVEGYRLMTDLGHHDIAFVCASHVLFGIKADEAEELGLPARDFLPRTYEQRIVPLVDYLIEGVEPTSLERRFSSLRDRNAGNDWFLSRLDRGQEAASGFLAHLDEVIGGSVEQMLAAAVRRSPSRRSIRPSRPPAG